MSFHADWKCRTFSHTHFAVSMQQSTYWNIVDIFMGYFSMLAVLYSLNYEFHSVFLLLPIPLTTSYLSYFLHPIKNRSLRVFFLQCFYLPVHILPMPFFISLTVNDFPFYHKCNVKLSCHLDSTSFIFLSFTSLPWCLETTKLVCDR